MVRRRIFKVGQSSAPSTTQVAQPLHGAVCSEERLIRQMLAGLGLMMLLVPALGVPSELMLQDTLKSMVVALMSLALLGWYAWRAAPQFLSVWAGHPLLLFPAVVALYALGSALWATNTYLAMVEAVRWTLLAVLAWLGLQTLRRGDFDRLALWIHAGAVIAAVWGLLQFWLNLKLFPQGHAPASTFVNRNFAAEFIVMVMPLSVHVLLRARSPALVAVLAYSLALNLVFVLACATRSALVALLLTAVPLACGLTLFRRHLAWPQWAPGTKMAAVGVFAIALLTLGLIPSAIPADGFHRVSAFERSLGRVQTVVQLDQDASVGMRRDMWATTVRMIRSNPLTGVGGGNWEVEQPLYQRGGEHLETDYYAHNEFLQHVAEYGVLGWLSALGLNALLALAAWRTWQRRRDEAMQAEGSQRVVALCSLFALFVVACAGFPWRMAATGALFALMLAAVAASDLRLGLRVVPSSIIRGAAANGTPHSLRPLAVVATLGLGLGAWVSVQAALCEYHIVRAAKLALGVSYASDPRDPQWNETKRIILDHLRQGIDINPHYRKLTPMPADDMAAWGDWPHAVEVWESVLRSRPYLVGLMVNVARGYAAMGEHDKAAHWVRQVRAHQPRSPGARSVEIVLLDQKGHVHEAATLARLYLDEKTVDADMAHNAYRLGIRTGDARLALDGLAWRTRLRPWEAALNHLRAGEIHDKQGDRAKALEEYRQALRLTHPEQHDKLRQQIPKAYLLLL